MDHIDKVEFKQLVLAIKNLLFIKMERANINNYIDIWMFIAKMSKLELGETHEAFIGKLKRIGNINKNWTYNDMTTNE